MSAVAYRSTIRKVEERRRAARAVKTGNKTPEGKDEYKFEYEFVGYGMILEQHGDWLIFDEPLPFAVGDQVEVVISKVEAR